MTIIQSSPQYTPILAPKQVVTGVRGWTGDDVILTGSIVADNGSTCMIYLGPLPDTDNGTVHELKPALIDRQVTSSTFYGPDTYVFNPEIGTGNIRAVGTFQEQNGQGRNHGMLFHGSPAGAGGWYELDVPEDIAGGKVWNTVPHSTMGDLVVGDFDLAGVPGSAGAFVHNIRTGSWTVLDLDGCTETTAYGIWQNGVGSGSYTIVGGTHDGAGINVGFILDYDSGNGQVSNLTYYRNPENPLLTHFEGITGVGNDRYNLAGQAEAEFALFTTVERIEGGFSDGPWFAAHVDGSQQTSGNTVYQNILMGIFTEQDAEVQSYAATYAPDQSARGVLRAQARDALVNRPRILVG